MIRRLMNLAILTFVVCAVLTALAATLPPEAEANGNGADNLTVLILDSGDTGSTITAAWTDTQECSTNYNVYIDGVDTSSVSLPDGLTVSDSGRIHAASVSSEATQVSATFSTLKVSADADHLSVSVFCGDDVGTGWLVATVDDIALDPVTRRPEQKSYSTGTSFGGLQLDGMHEAIGDGGSDSPDFLVADRSGRVLPNGGTGDIDYSSIRVGFANGVANASETHSSISTTIADSGTTGSTFTITWVDSDTCTGNYNLYMDNIDSGTVVLPTGVTQDSRSGRISLGAVAATTDPSRKPLHSPLSKPSLTTTILPSGYIAAATTPVVRSRAMSCPLTAHRSGLLPESIPVRPGSLISR